MAKSKKSSESSESSDSSESSESLVKSVELIEPIDQREWRMIWNSKSIIILSSLVNIMMLLLVYVLSYKMPLEAIPQSLVMDLLSFYDVHMNFPRSETSIWDYVQTKMNCCGVNGPDDWEAYLKFIPSSCCSETNRTCVLWIGTEMFYPRDETWRGNKVINSCKVADTKVGCYEAIRKEIRRHLWPNKSWFNGTIISA